MGHTRLYTENGYLFTDVQIGNEPTSLTTLQSFLYPYVDLIEIGLWILWVVVLCFVIRRLISLSTNSSSSADSR